MGSKQFKAGAIPVDSFGIRWCYGDTMEEAIRKISEKFGLPKNHYVYIKVRVPEGYYRAHKIIQLEKDF